LSVRPRSGEQVPSLTEQIARASNSSGTTAMWVKDRLDGLWRDEDFIDWYPRDGRPGLSPAQLATVCVLQFLLNLSDRHVTESVRCRIDFKYALAMELDDPGFHRSVLADFRERLAQGDRAACLTSRWPVSRRQGSCANAAPSAPIPPTFWPPYAT
jgi:transposase